MLGKTISEKCSSDATGGHGDAEKEQPERDKNILRSFSMNIAHDQAGNPYVDLPSKMEMGTISLMLPSEAMQTTKTGSA